MIHNIALPPGEYGGEAIDDLFMGRLDPSTHPYFKDLEGLRVSAHYLIRRDGTLIQYVDPDKRAWHAGVSSWKGRERCNDFSIGIELEGSDFEPFTQLQYTTLAALTQALRARYHLTDVTGHEHIAPGRKTDPGPWFDWGRYRVAVS